jgi:hypothetical protein
MFLRLPLMDCPTCGFANPQLKRPAAIQLGHRQSAPDAAVASSLVPYVAAWSMTYIPDLNNSLPPPSILHCVPSLSQPSPSSATVSAPLSLLSQLLDVLIQLQYIVLDYLIPDHAVSRFSSLFLSS